MDAAQNLGGVQVDANSDLLSRTLRLAGAVSGSLTGPISVGQVFRLQIGGDAQATITANGSYNFSSGEVMDHVVVGGAVQAPITLTGGPLQNASLASLVAGAIQSSVNVPKGHIVELRSYGPISISAPGGIITRDGITSLQALAQDNTTAQDISAAIVANYENSGGALHFLIANTVSGSVTAANLGGFTPVAGEGFFARGDLDAPILIAYETTAPIDVRGAFTTNAYVQVGLDLGHDVIAHGSITSIVVGRSVLAPPDRHIIIKSETGDIGLLNVQGTINPCSFGCPPGVDVQVFAAGKVHEIVVGGGPGSISGFSVRNSVAPLGGYVAVGTLTTEGHLALDMRCSTFEDIRIGGGLSGTGDGTAQDPEEEVHFLEFPAGRSFRVGHFLAANIFVDGVQAFHGQIMNNAAGVEVSGWRDSHDVFVLDDSNDFVTLVPHPDYTQRSPNLGGGSVGSILQENDRNFNVVYAGHLHNQDCEPVNQADMCQTPMPLRRWPGETSDRETAVLRHYVPVFNSWTGGVYKVWRAPTAIECTPGVPCEPTWLDVTALFDVVVAPVTDPSAPWSHEREVWVSPAARVWDRSYHYRVELMDYEDGVVRTRLRAGGTYLSSADAPNISGYPYYLYFPLCMDMNLSSVVEPGDVAAWLEGPMDFNVDGATDADDLGMLLDAVSGTTP